MLKIALAGRKSSMNLSEKLTKTPGELSNWYGHGLRLLLCCGYDCKWCDSGCHRWLWLSRAGWEKEMDEGERRREVRLVLFLEWRVGTRFISQPRL